MSSFDEKLKSICTYHSDDGTSGYQLSEEQFDQIKQLISEVIGEIEIVHFDDANSADLRFRDGANERLGRNKLRRQLRHAFNLNQED